MFLDKIMNYYLLYSITSYNRSLDEPRRVCKLIYDKPIKALKKSLEQELTILQEMLDSNPIQQNHEYFETNKTELEKIEKD